MLLSEQYSRALLQRVAPVLRNESTISKRNKSRANSLNLSKNLKVKDILSFE